MARAGMELNAGGSERFCRLSGSRTGGKGVAYRFGGHAAPALIEWRLDPTAWTNAAAAPGEGQLVDRSLLLALPSPGAEGTWSVFKRSEHLAMYQMAVGAMGNSGTLSDAALHLRRISELGFTAIQLLPLTLHHRVEWRNGPDSVWVRKDELRSGPPQLGYGVASWFAVDASFGTPDQLAQFVDCAHRQGLAVFVDLVFGHVSETALGTFLPKSAAPRKNHFGPLPDFGQPEVTSLALASLRSWLTAFRVDGVRIDTAVDLRKTNVGKALLRTIARTARQFGALVIAEEVYDYLPGRNFASAGQGLYDFRWDGSLLHALVRAALTLSRFMPPFREDNFNEVGYFKAPGARAIATGAVAKLLSEAFTCKDGQPVGNRVQS